MNIALYFIFQVFGGNTILEISEKWNKSPWSTFLMLLPYEKACIPSFLQLLFVLLNAAVQRPIDKGEETAFRSCHLFGKSGKRVRNKIMEVTRLGVYKAACIKKCRSLYEVNRRMSGRHLFWGWGILERNLGRRCIFWSHEHKDGNWCHGISLEGHVKREK